LGGLLAGTRGHAIASWEAYGATSRKNVVV